MNPTYTTLPNINLTHIFLTNINPTQTTLKTHKPYSYFPNKLYFYFPHKSFLYFPNKHKLYSQTTLNYTHNTFIMF